MNTEESDFEEALTGAVAEALAAFWVKTGDADGVVVGPWPHVRRVLRHDVIYHPRCGDGVFYVFPRDKAMSLAVDSFEIQVARLLR